MSEEKHCTQFVGGKCFFTHYCKYRSHDVYTKCNENGIMPWDALDTKNPSKNAQRTYLLINDFGGGYV